MNAQRHLTYLSFGFLATALLGLAGCSTDRDPNELLVPEDVGVLTVDAVLTVSKQFPAIRISRTGAPGDPFNVADVLVQRDIADMRIRNDDSSVIVKYTYDSQSNSGFWVPIASDSRYRVDPETRYELVVKTEAAEVLSATTITPPLLDVDDWVILDDAGEEVIRRFASYDDVNHPDEIYLANEIVYSTGLLEAQFQRPDVPAFEVGIFSLDLGSDYVIDPDFFDEEDFDSLDRETSSPPIESEDGTLRLPWFAIFFEGRYSIKIYAMDQNWYDLARSAPGFGDGGVGFGGQAGDDFERPIFHVEGGIGLFGSTSVDSIGFYVQPRP
ncbi:MAG: DUF4249 family protein [Candidatus Eisenbacteria bacterium]|uniref:DUF4249 family protein n=1 Tax=Eiseniibacteriota bacterium TaxID=2212470 RepID=A0A956NFC6_UNCEI|nr:DUF4249 family protein [Candidatus Eisenbacteria bacterium]MCB9465917.1 DUF4249 family protein [Candidatus Eisenbacteria bacterium]